MQSTVIQYTKHRIVVKKRLLATCWRFRWKRTNNVDMIAGMDGCFWMPSPHPYISRSLPRLRRSRLWCTDDDPCESMKNSNPAFANCSCDFCSTDDGTDDGNSTAVAEKGRYVCMHACTQGRAKAALIAPQPLSSGVVRFAFLLDRQTFFPAPTQAHPLRLILTH